MAQAQWGPGIAETTSQRGQGEKPGPETRTWLLAIQRANSQEALSTQMLSLPVPCQVPRNPPQNQSQTQFSFRQVLLFNL